jgi:hypothetical protein
MGPKLRYLVVRAVSMSCRKCACFIVQNAAELAVVNIVSFLHEMEAGRPYSLTTAHEIYSGLGSDSTAVAPSATIAADGSPADDGMLCSCRLWPGMADVPTD